MISIFNIAFSFIIREYAKTITIDDFVFRIMMKLKILSESREKEKNSCGSIRRLGNHSVVRLISSHFLS